MTHAKIPFPLLFFFLTFSAWMFVACGQAQQQPALAISSRAAPVRYNLQAPEVFELPAAVSEISGMAWEKDNFVFAVDDEKGSLFRIKLQKEPAVEEWKFGKKNDYEELVQTGDQFYLLSSSGAVVYFSTSLPVENVHTAKLSLKGRNEFEILLKDPTANRLLMMCKSCKADKKNEVSVFAFDLGTKTFHEKAAATLKVKDIEEKLQQKIGAFKPSGGNVHPQTGDIYLVSSINQLLVVTDHNFEVKEVHKLPAGLFKQPEALCFTPSGDLLISNEAAGQGNATILLFRKEGP